MNKTEFWTKELMDAIDDKSLNRQDLGILYGVVMHYQNEEKARADWSKINHKILTRYTQSGLVFIKERAWKMMGKPIPDCVLVSSGRLETRP